MLPPSACGGRNEARPSAAALIIAPTSVLGNWQRELRTFSPQLKAVLHYGPRRPKGEAFVPAYQDADVVLTSYGPNASPFGLRGP